MAENEPVTATEGAVGVPVAHEHVGTVEHLHALDMPAEGDRPQLWVMRPTTAAVAMGSAQKPELFDTDHLHGDDVQLAPRRSGGGAVFLEPQSLVWIDVLAPRSSPLWHSDLAQNFLIVGRVWQHALRSLGVESTLCESAPQKTPEASLACWAGVGWGELTIGTSKVLGLSQRRTRWGSRVQGMVVLDDSARRIVDYLPAEHRAAVRAAIPPLSEVFDVPVTAAEVEAAVLSAFDAVQP